MNEYRVYIRGRFWGRVIKVKAQTMRLADGALYFFISGDVVAYFAPGAFKYVTEKRS